MGAERVRFHCRHSGDKGIRMRVQFYYRHIEDRGIRTTGRYASEGKKTPVARIDSSLLQLSLVIYISLKRMLSILNHHTLKTGMRKCLEREFTTSLMQQIVTNQCARIANRLLNRPAWRWGSVTYILHTGTLAPSAPKTLGLNPAHWCRNKVRIV